MNKSLVLLVYCINQTIFSNSKRRNRRIEISIVIISTIIISIGILYFSGNPLTETPTSTPTPNPITFDYRLDVASVNDTILQGKSVDINVTISYLQGEPKNVTLTASGIPSNADYTFSQSRGFPTNNKTFNSILTIYVSEAVPKNSYPITINSAADNGKSYTFPYTLFVLDSGISVSGRIDGGIDVSPTEIIFELVKNTGEHTQRFTAAVESGNYVISLPNNEFYAVAVGWEKLDGSSGIYYFIQPYRVNVGVGVTFINCPFSFGLLPTTD